MSSYSSKSSFTMNTRVLSGHQRSTPQVGVDATSPGPLHAVSMKDHERPDRLAAEIESAPSQPRDLSLGVCA